VKFDYFRMIQNKTCFEASFAGNLMLVGRVALAPGVRERGQTDSM